MNMKKIFRCSAVLLFFLLLSVPSFGTNNTELRANYVIKELKLNKAMAAKFRPTCLAYLKELKVAKATYSSLKDKYKSAIKNGTLSNGQATALMKYHLDSDRKELTVKQKYYPLFCRILSAKQAYYAFGLANDSMKKVKGQKSQKDKNAKTADDDDDE
jgi:hypothetical protein